MKKKATTTIRRKVISRAATVKVPDRNLRFISLMKLTTPKLKKLLRAAQIGIPKEKHVMAYRLAECESVCVAITTEAVVFGKGRAV